MQSTLFLNFYHFLCAKKKPKDTQRIRVFSETSHSAKKELPFLQAEIREKSGRVAFDQMQVSKAAQSQKEFKQKMIKYSK